MKKQLLRFTLYAIIIYLTCGALNLDVAASPPVGGSGTHFHGVIDGQWDKHIRTNSPTGTMPEPVRRTWTSVNPARCG